MYKIIYSDPANNKEIKDLTKIDMHCHTTASDGVNSTAILVKKAKKLGFGLSITDHNAISSCLKAHSLMPFVIPGIEITSNDATDILAYFYTTKDLQSFYEKHIKNNTVSNPIFDLKKLKWDNEELIDFIKAHNGIVSLPHPFTIEPKKSYNHLKNNREIIKKLDAIEVINAMMDKEANEKAIKWCKKLNLSATAGSDAHIVDHLGNVLTANHSNNVEEFLDNVLKKRTVLIGTGLTGIERIKSDALIVYQNLKW